MEYAATVQQSNSFLISQKWYICESVPGISSIVLVQHTGKRFYCMMWFILVEYAKYLYIESLFQSSSSKQSQIKQINPRETLFLMLAQVLIICPILICCMIVEDVRTGHMLIALPKVCPEEDNKSLSTNLSVHHQHNDYYQELAYSLQAITSPKVVSSHALSKYTENVINCCQSIYVFSCSSITFSNLLEGISCILTGL